MILSLILVLFTCACVAQTQFTRAIGGTSCDGGNSVVQTMDRGFAVAGRTESFGAGNFDLFLVKFDAAGNTCIGNAVIPTVTSQAHQL